MGAFFDRLSTESTHDSFAERQKTAPLAQALLWLGPIRREYETYALAADDEELLGFARCLGRLRRLEQHTVLSPSDQLFLEDVALQLAFWDTSSDGRGTWRSLAADDLSRLARTVL
jgi:hypothetical protein